MAQTDDSPAAIRKRLKAAKVQLDTTYIQMGRDLHRVYFNRMYLGWGYNDFRDYCHLELCESVSRCERMWRIWGHFVKDCLVPPRFMQGLSYHHALALMEVTDRTNASERVRKAKGLTIPALKHQIAAWKGPSNEAVAGLPKRERSDKDKDKDKDKSEADDESQAESQEPENVPERKRITLSFHLYPDQEQVVNAALDEARRGTPRGSAPNEALANICTEFLGARMSKERTPVTRLAFMLHVLESIYGGKIIWVPDGEASKVLREAMAARPDLFEEHAEEEE